MKRRRWALAGFCAVSLWLLGSAPVALAATARETPWWEQQKIRFFWGPWGMWYPLGSPHTGHGSVDTLPDEEIIARAAQVGATVFTDRCEWTFEDALTEKQVEMAKTAWLPEETRRLFLLHLRSANLDRARLAHRHGMRYFAHRHSAYLPTTAQRIGARLAVNKDGKTSLEEPRAGGQHVPCPLDEKAADEWLFKYAEDMAGNGLIDGCHIDWEMSVGAFVYEIGDDVCYCDDCWENYTTQTGLAAPLARAERYPWLVRHGRLREYLTHQQARVIDLYRRGAGRVRAIKPDFIFSAYTGFMPGHIESSWFLEGAARGLNAPDAPFFVINASFYYPNHTVPWWDAGYARLRELGMKHVLGFYTSGFMGTPTMDVGAARQLYDAAVNHDGYWVWFEHQWGPQDIAVFRTADRLVRATESKVGRFLFGSEADDAFVTPVEQSGDPDLGRNIVTRTYHLEDRHLAHINNVNTDHSVSVLVRFPRLDPGGEWTVTDPLTDLVYTRQGEATWHNEDLESGVLLAMEKRSEAWLLVAPRDAGPGSASIDPLRTVAADVIKGHPARPATGPLPPPGSPAPGEFPLVFTRTGPLGYNGAHHPVMGASVFRIDAAAGSAAEDAQLFAIKGDCWSPRLSPDRKKVVFSSYVNGQGQIYLVNADATVLTGFPGRELPGKPYWVNTLPVGTQPAGSFAFKAQGVNLSGNAHCEHSPVWSPDGNRIAFVSDRDGDLEIYVMNADGSGQTRLTHAPGTDRRPAWSPDGKRIAFESDRSGDFDICVVGSDGNDERVLVERSGQDLEPVWSPDGTRIAFVGNQCGYHRDLMLVDPDTRSLDYPRGLLFSIAGWWPYMNVHGIAWSPDGKHIAGAFENRFDTGVFVAYAGSGRAAADAAEIIIGDQFIYDADRAKGDLIDVAKAPPLRTRPGGVHEFLKHGISGGWYMSGDASNRWILRTFKDISWSPDGSTVAFRSDMDPSGYEFFYTVPAAGGEPVRLDNTQSPMGVANTATPLNTVNEAQESSKAPGAPGLPDGKKVLAQAPEVWMFRTDPDKVGQTEKWFAESPEGLPWTALSTHDFWDKILGTKKDPHYVGDAWYAVDMVIPSAQDKKVWLHFGAVDENYTLWINGDYIADNLAAGTTMWDQPASVEITGRYMEGRPNRIVVRVRNTAFAGGIWKPVTLLVEK